MESTNIIVPSNLHNVATIGSDIDEMINKKEK